MNERALIEQKKEGYRLEGEGTRERDEYVLYLLISHGQVFVPSFMKDK
jgi:hypothetical protein